MSKKKILITYVFFESKKSLININFFIKNGVFHNNNVQYNFIIKGNKCSVKFPDYKNIKVYKMKNEGYDFGGYSYSIQTINKNTFDYYIFLNDTVIGPFIPRYNSKYIWYEYFISLISDKVKLVGPTINRRQYNNISEHVQSMAFGTDNIGLELLIENNVFNLKNNIKVYKNKGKWEFIMNFEVGMSGIIIKNGYEICSFMQSDNYHKKLKHGDIHLTNKYFSINLNPVEIMFIKNNRIDDLISKRYTYWNS
jgi:hypothetical protein